MNIDEQIAECEKKIVELQKKREQLKSLSPAQRVAELLHGKFCHYNHTDGCGWFYFDWNNLPRNSDRQCWLDKAEKLLLKFDEQTIQEFLGLL